MSTIVKSLVPKKQSFFAQLYKSLPSNALIFAYISQFSKTKIKLTKFAAIT